MALADSVPGVSGGTIAFILGFYDQFVNSLNSLISGYKKGRVNALKFLSKIGLGWIVGFILSVLFITSIFEKNIYNISSLFLGFIVGAMTYFNPATGMETSFSIKSSDLSIPLMIYIFVSGMIAISAMVLPGISGSTILLIFGLYAPILNAIKEVLKFNFEYILALSIFAGGVVLGVLLTVRAVRYLLKTYRSQTIYCIIGLMIGSIYAVMMGPTSLEVPKAPMELSTFSIAFFGVGAVLVPGLEVLKKVLKDKNEEVESLA